MALSSPRFPLSLRPKATHLVLSFRAFWNKQATWPCPWGCGCPIPEFRLVTDGRWSPLPSRLSSGLRG